MSTQSQENTVLVDVFFGVKKVIDFAVRLTGPLFVILATVLISGIIVVYFKAIIPYYSEYTDLFGIWNLCLGAWMASNIVYNYFMAVFTPPGESPASFSVSSEELERIKNDQHPQFKWCKKCNRIKPPRSHHCHICKKCVLRMDHHCPWISNCVGFGNHKYFFLFLFYLCTSTAYVALLAYQPFRVSTNFKMPWKGFSSRGTIMFTFVVTMAVTAAVGFMMAWNLYLLLTNQTTIEFYTNQYKASKARSKGESFFNEFDLGSWKNFQQFFGVSGRSAWLGWLMPSPRSPLGNGIEYPTRSFHNNKAKDETV